MAKYISKKHKEDIYKALGKVERLTELVKKAADEIDEVFPDDYNVDKEQPQVTKAVKKDVVKTLKDFKTQVDRIAEW